MIKFYFIKNISRLDTIKFSNINQQQNYFDNFIESRIDSIYPPHFQNRIQVSIEDLSPSTKVNYLSLDFNEKTYYYFIDNINYINEGVYEIGITMDTIQTFLFDITINEGLLERYSIKRWNDDGTINRHYIRENLSKGHFVNDYCNQLIFDNLGNIDNLEYLPCILLHRRAPLDNEKFPDGVSIEQCIINYDNLVENYAITDGSYYYLFPLFPSDVTSITFSIDIKGDFYHSLTRYLYYYFLLPLLEDNNTVDAYLVDNSILNQLFYYTNTFSEIGNERYIDIRTYNNGNCSIMKFGSSDISEFEGLCIKLGNLNLKTNTDIIDIKYKNDNFTINNEVNKNFNIKYLPQLIDNNYINIKFGEKMEYTTFPLYNLSNNTITLFSQCDLFSGSRTYRIIENLDDTLDKYMTNIIVQTKETINLYKDALTNYMQTNKGSLTMGVALAKQNAQWNMAKNLFNDYQENNRGVPLSTINGGLNKTKLSQSIANYAFTLGDTFMELYNIDTQLEINKTNAEYTPDTTRQGNNYTADLNSLSLKTILIQETVNDIEYVGHKFEQYGYLINEEIHEDQTLNYFNTRYYFNVIKFKDVSITLEYICSNDLLQNIKERLQNGLRMWNIHDESYSSLPIIDYNKFNYDNVENEYIEE